MTIKVLEGGNAIAESTLNCEPEVVACYPITPSTPIAEAMAAYYANGLIKEFIDVEAEFSALSSLIGASAAGARTFSTTSSQGLLLMHEAIFNAAGMRLPIVMAVANRAVSAPLNIWNDLQDSISQRDTGWLQFYARTNQQAVDLMPQAFKIAEKTMIPAMVCVDGFYLTHKLEQIDVPEKKLIKEFLPEFNPKVKLDPNNPLSLGVYAGPAHYQEFRADLHEDLINSLNEIKKQAKEFEELTKRKQFVLEEFKTEDADFILIGLGSMMSNVFEAVKELREKGEKVGAIHLNVFRPFPSKELRKALEGKKIGVIDRALSLGAKAPLYLEIREALPKEEISSFYGALGGRAITRKEAKKIFEMLKQKVKESWIATKNSKISKEEASEGG